MSGSAFMNRRPLIRRAGRMKLWRKLSQNRQRNFELPELPEGVYRVAFQFLDPEQKAEEYQVIQPEEENGEEPEYQFAFPEEEEKEVLDCFAYIESYVVEEGSSLELKLEKKEAEPETTPEVTPETTPEGTRKSEPETTPEATRK